MTAIDWTFYPIGGDTRTSSVPSREGIEEQEKNSHNAKRRLVEIKFLLTSQSIVFENAINTYQKGDLFCVMTLDQSGNRSVYKYPIPNIFQVKEDY